MDYIPDSQAIRAMTRVIVDDVIPRTAQGYPRGQLWAVAGLLSNLAIDLENREQDAELGSIRPVAMAIGDVLDDETVLDDARRHHEELRALIARQAPLNSGRAVLGA